jgi:hypothetical protein
MQKSKKFNTPQTKKIEEGDTTTHHKKTVPNQWETEKLKNSNEKRGNILYTEEQRQVRSDFFWKHYNWEAGEEYI